jgi:hypothetical protein
MVSTFVHSAKTGNNVYVPIDSKYGEPCIKKEEPNVKSKK